MIKITTYIADNSEELILYEHDNNFILACEKEYFYVAKTEDEADCIAENIIYALNNMGDYSLMQVIGMAISGRKEKFSQLQSFNLNIIDQLSSTVMGSKVAYPEDLYCNLVFLASAFLSRKYLLGQKKREDIEKENAHKLMINAYQERNDVYRDYVVLSGHVFVTQGSLVQVYSNYEILEGACRVSDLVCSHRLSSTVKGFERESDLLIIYSECGDKIIFDVNSNPIAPFIMKKV